jgi:hypothetical protein
MAFAPNRKFKRRYRQIFRKNPEAANLYLLLCELADQKGKFMTNEQELVRLMAARFNDPKEYSLKGISNE